MPNPIPTQEMEYTLLEKKVAATTTPSSINQSLSGTLATESVKALAHRGYGTTWLADKGPNSTFLLPSSAANNNAQTMATGSIFLSTVTGYNASAGVRYIKIYNKATTPAAASDTPRLVIAVPAGATFSYNFDGHYFSTGIGLLIVTGAANTDNTAGSAGDILGLTVAYAT